jgi:hypothetical protein
VVNSASLLKIVKTGEIPGFGIILFGVLELETTKYGGPLRTV